ncbi:hypothetical protein KUV57_13525 [Epibacterium sp. DP7N7-1]|nr:hypothetical protein [Epibacterium sp. DP7N7-1]
MFFRTIAVKPLRNFTSNAPGEDGDIFEREHGISASDGIGAYLDHMMDHASTDHVRTRMIDDMHELREAGLLGSSLAIEGRNIDFLEKWNAFLEGNDSEEVARAVITPIEALVKNFAVRLFTSSKNRRGPVRAHHMSAAIDMETAERRIPIVEPLLNDHLRSGSFPAQSFGARSDHDGTGLVQVKLQKFQPSFERARDVRNVMTWYPIETVEIDVDRDDDFEPVM